MKKLILLIVFSFLISIPAKTENLSIRFKTEFSSKNFSAQPKDKKPKKKKKKRSITKKNECGTERWDVKTLTDTDAKKINFNNIVDTTILGLAKAKIKKIKGDSRKPYETTVYRITGILKQYKIEDDKDIHIMLEDQYSNYSIVIEILNPECPEVKNSSRYDMFKKIKDDFDKEYKPTKSWKYSSNIVTVTGVGFIDFLHGQTGMADNGRELHPVLSFHIDQR